MRLALGTAQFGLDYGVSNPDGKCPPSEVARIVERAAAAGVTMIDTAPAYGSAEKVLGEIIPTGHGFRIVTKTPNFATAASPAEAADLVERALETSLDLLHLDGVHAVLIHQADDMFTGLGEAVFARLESLRDADVIGKVGVSIYTAGQIERSLAEFSIRCFQAPVNVLDQRLVSGGQLAALKERRIEIHGRSIFLQGVLLMPPDDLPPHLDSLRPDLARYHEVRRRAGLTAIEAPVEFVAQLGQLDYAVVGVTSAEQFDEIAAAARDDNNHSLDWAALASSHEILLNPSQWPSPPRHGGGVEKT